MEEFELSYNEPMEEHDLIEDYLEGKMIDPCEYGQYELEKLAEYLGEEE